jgi:hypothetical protein
VFLNADLMQDVTNPFSIPSFYCMAFLSSLIFYNISFLRDQSNLSSPSMNHISTHMLFLLEEFSQDTQFHRTLTMVYNKKVGTTVMHPFFYFLLNAAPGRVSIHRIATLPSSTRIIGAPVSHMRSTL